MADFGFANFGDDDDNEEEEFTFQVNGICMNFRFNCSTLMNCMKHCNDSNSIFLFHQFMLTYNLCIMEDILPQWKNKVCLCLSLNVI